jgi:hypothetical protein
MALDKDRNRVLTALRGQPEGLDSATLAQALALTQDVVERHLTYCVDYALAHWIRKKDGSGRAVITDRGRDYLARQNL